MKLSCTKYMLFLAVALLLLGVAACTQSKPVVPTATLPLTTPGLPPVAVGTPVPGSTVGPLQVVTVPPGATAPAGQATAPAGQATLVVPPGQPTMLPTPTTGAGGAQPTQVLPTPENPLTTPEAPTAPVVQGNCPNPYKVQQGEWMNQIAQKCGVPLDALLAANGMTRRNATIRPGQLISIPSGTSTTPPPQQGGQGRTYVVQRGDNLFRIALRFGVTLEDLMRRNGIYNPNFIYVGQVLIIP